MVAAGLDTLPSNMSMTVAYLSSPHGQELQDKAYSEIMKDYPDGDAWDACIQDERCTWMVAFVKEVLRFWSTVNMSFTRESVKEIVYNGATIPAGTPFFLVSSILPALMVMLTCFFSRMSGVQTTTMPNSRTPCHSVLSGSLTCRKKEVVPSISRMEPEPVGAQVLTLQIGNSTPCL